MSLQKNIVFTDLHYVVGGRPVPNSINGKSDLYIDDSSGNLNPELSALKGWNSVPSGILPGWNSRTSKTSLNSIIRDVSTFASDTFLNAIEFVSDNVGFILAGGAEILKTEDGGETWEQVFMANNNHLNAIEFISEDVGFVVGRNGILLKTTDGGETWVQKISTIQSFNSIFFVYNRFLTTNVGFVGSNTGTLLKTTDEGETWEEISLPFLVDIRDIFFISEDIGFILTTSLSTSLEGIYKTTDGGQTWENKVSGQVFRDIFVKSNGVGFALGNFLLKTEDEGETWENVDTITTAAFEQRLYEIMFVTDDVGYIIGGSQNALLKTIDGGETWEHIISSFDSNFSFRTGFFFSEDVGFLFALIGNLLKINKQGLVLSNSDNLRISGFFIDRDETTNQLQPFIQTPKNMISINLWNGSDVSKSSPNIYFGGLFVDSNGFPTQQNIEGEDYIGWAIECKKSVTGAGNVLLDIQKLVFVKPFNVVSGSNSTIIDTENVITPSVFSINESKIEAGKGVCIQIIKQDLPTLSQKLVIFKLNSFDENGLPDFSKGFDVHEAPVPEIVREILNRPFTPWFSGGGGSSTINDDDVVFETVDNFSISVED